ncbi:hypothetical protein [Planomonospora venezuelensis]|uniref:MFS transporter n=1 Tax=Planomonospora venezuelensis TaxID=1999 RepID=A0A841D8H8_PLAVE|nr:hypothetical protein [Planomonospora venezuelensis]MBB5966942.1 hypothetical protein [Planomonospora venezuelensis]GIN02444.1 hypothetical protein Pve01_41020 [Planomonospora venezuelensis]
MAVPQKSAQAVAAGSTVPVRALSSSLPIDIVLGLLVMVALPLAIVAIPNTIAVVKALLPADVAELDMVRAHGLALPAMVLTVPLAAVVVRRMRAAPILVGGLTLLALADAAGGYAGSPLVVGILRVAHGVGAGLLVPATLVAVWERPRILRAVWAGVLAVSLLAAQALALWPLDEATSWRITLQPYPLLTGVALALSALYLVLWLRSGQSAAAGPGPSSAERGRLLMTTAPAVGIVVLALGATFGWAPELIAAAALLSVLALLGLASVGTFEGVNGRTLAYTTVAVGVVALPTAAQVTYVGLGGLGGPGLSGLWQAFTAAGVAGLAAAVLAGRLKDQIMPLVAAGGLVVMVGGLCAVRFLLPAAGGPALVIPFLLLAVGAATALTSALRPSGPGAALFALSLFFPGVLAGFMLGSGVLLLRLREAVREAASAQSLVDAYVSALHLWALIGGALVVAVIVLGAILARRAPTAPGTAAADSAAGEEGRPVTAPEPEPERGAARSHEPGREAGHEPDAGQEPEPESAGTGPVVPSPMSSPEGSTEDRPADA